MRSADNAPTLGPAWKPVHTGLIEERTGFPWPAFPPIEEAAVMKWETPKAFDTRFGFEITMYISNR